MISNVKQKWVVYHTPFYPCYILGAMCLIDCQSPRCRQDHTYPFCGKHVLRDAYQPIFDSDEVMIVAVVSRYAKYSQVEPW